MQQSDSSSDAPAPGRAWRSLAISAAGVALVAPAAILAGAPRLQPHGLLARVAGAPLLIWTMLALMGGLVVVALVAALTLRPSDL
jgi:hypothetical protein